MTLDDNKVHQKQNCFVKELAFSLNASQRRNPPKKTFLSGNVIFRGLKLSLGHFG